MIRYVNIDVNLTVPCRVQVDIDGEEVMRRRPGSAEPDYVVEPIVRILSFEPQWPDDMTFKNRTRIYRWLKNEIVNYSKDIEAQALEELRDE